MEKSKIIPHGSEQWKSERYGRFTPSELHRLMTEPRIKTEVLSQGAITYIKEKVTETLIEDSSEETQFSNAATAWGNSYEDEAINIFSDLVDTEIIRPGLIIYNDYFCGTPDGIAKDKSFGIEVKCPYNSSIHLDNLLLSKEDFRKARKEYYYQIQGYAILTGINDWYFVSYDPRQKESLRMVHLSINKDEVDVSLIHKKLKVANYFKQSLLHKLNK
jgi:hypothetical protein